MNKLHNKRETLLGTMAVATFIIFFQLYMVAPLIPSLSVFFRVSEQQIGLIVPAFLFPYGIFSLFHGIFADKLGPKKIILSSFLAFTILTFFTAFSATVSQLLLWRFLTGIVASGVIPISLSWIGRTYTYEERGRPIGWLFGAMAGGGAFGSSFGVILEPFVGWQMLFTGVAILSAITWIILFLNYDGSVTLKISKSTLTLKKVFNGYHHLLMMKRGKAAYIFVLLNGIFHAGVFTWLGLYFKETYDLSNVQIGLALVGYGLPGFIFGPFIGKLADKKGRSKLMPMGLILSAISALILIFDVPLGVAAFGVTILSLGYDLTQPLLAGIITQVGKEISGQAMSLMAFTLFIGFGLGSYLFGEALHLGMTNALIIFSLFQTILFVIAVPLFKNEKHSSSVKVVIKRTPQEV